MRWPGALIIVLAAVATSHASEIHDIVINTSSTDLAIKGLCPMGLGIASICLHLCMPLRRSLLLLPEAVATGAMPALPLVLFVLEGHVEPHTKWFSWYDFFIRWAGVLGLCGMD